MLQPVASVQQLEEAADAVTQGTVHKDVKDYILTIAEATRHTSRLLMGVSPRASLALLRAAMSFAAVSGRDYVTPDDVKDIAVPVLAHRLVLKNTVSRSEGNEQALIRSILEEVKASPTEEEVYRALTKE